MQKQTIFQWCASRAMRQLPMFGLLALVASGCYTVKTVAPRDVEVTIADAVPPGDETDSKKHVYMLYGLLPLNDNTTATIIPADCKKVAVSTEMTAVDGLVSGGLAFLNSVLWVALANSRSVPPDVAAIGAVSMQLLLPQLRTSKASCTEWRPKSAVAPPAPSSMPPMPAVPSSQPPVLPASSGFACVSDRDCPGSAICEAGRCVEPPVRAGCKSDADCKAGRACVDGRCVSR